MTRGTSIEAVGTIWRANDAWQLDPWSPEWSRTGVRHLMTEPLNLEERDQGLVRFENGTLVRVIGIMLDEGRVQLSSVRHAEERGYFNPASWLVGRGGALHPGDLSKVVAERLSSLTDSGSVAFSVSQRVDGGAILFVVAHVPEVVETGLRPLLGEALVVQTSVFTPEQIERAEEAVRSTDADLLAVERGLSEEGQVQLRVIPRMRSSQWDAVAADSPRGLVVVDPWIRPLG